LIHKATHAVANLMSPRTPQAKRNGDRETKTDTERQRKSEAEQSEAEQSETEQSETEQYSLSNTRG